MLTGISLSIRQYVCTSVFVQNTTLCLSAGRGIKSHSVTALDLFGKELNRIFQDVPTEETLQKHG